MTASATLSARQTAPGEPIKVIARQLLPTLADYGANTDGGVGVKIGATPPTNVSEFAEVFKAYGPDGESRVSQRTITKDEAATAWYWAVQHRRTIPLSATVVAGRYLFSYLEGAAGAVQAVSPAYLIT